MRSIGWLLRFLIQGFVIRDGLVRDDGADGGVDALPFGQQLGEDGFAFGREEVEALVAFFVLAPFAGQQALGFESAEEGVEGAFVDVHALLGEGFAEGVTVLLGTEGGEDGENEAAAAEFQAKVVEGIGVHRLYCVIHRM
jgi:hypothetical protein